MMKTRTMVSIVGLTASAMLAMVLLLVSGGTTGEYHAGELLFCYDCHTMHYSMQHGWDSAHTTPIPYGPMAAGGNWLGAGGPNARLLKLPANELCKSCHDGQTFAPDVVGVNTNLIAGDGGRSAGALTDGTAGYEVWKGHTLDSNVDPPGYAPALVGLSATHYNASNGLECVSCHSAHGSKPAYRNLGPRGFSSSSSIRANFMPTYVIGAANNTSMDVWIQVTGYTAGTGNAATFNPFYTTANIHFNETFTKGTTIGSGLLQTSNRMGSFCAACHANFHGGDGDTASVSLGAGQDFKRHPTAGVQVPNRYNTGRTTAPAKPPVTRVRIFGDQPIGTAATGSPGCPTCHKAHGNQNPFGLIFLNQLAPAANFSEEGGLAPTQTGLVTDPGQGLRNLCWQCHGMGATDAGY
jgi:hypothetical protein